MKGLTAKQVSILDFISEFQRREGMAPTVPELAAYKRKLQALREACGSRGLELAPRLTVYPQFGNRDWVD